MNATLITGIFFTVAGVLFYNIAIHIIQNKQHGNCLYSKDTKLQLFCESIVEGDSEIRGTNCMDVSGNISPAALITSVLLKEGFVVKKTELFCPQPHK